MKVYSRIWWILGMLCIGLNSCKLDKPIQPGDPGYVDKTVPVVTSGTVTGTVVSGTMVNNPNLTAAWKVATTTKEYFDENNVVVASSVAFNLFTAVTLNDAAKTAGFSGLTAAVPSAETYTLSASGGNLYIQLSADPFSRSVNSKIQVTNLTATSMTWVAIDSKEVIAGGQPLRNAYEVTFTK